MKEAKEFGIKYLKTMPDKTQRFVMHQFIWTDRKEAEQMVENLKGVVACPTLVEFWDPDDICNLIEESEECPKDCPGNSQKGILPDEKESTVGDQKILEGVKKIVQDDPYCEKKTITYVGHPNGTCTVKVNGKDITDPEQQKKIREELTKGIDGVFDNWLFPKGFGGIDPKPRKDEKVEDPRDWRTFWPKWIVDFDNLPRYSC